MASGFFEQYRPRTLSEHISGLHWRMQWAQDSQDRLLDASAMREPDMTLVEEVAQHEVELQSLLHRGAEDVAAATAAGITNLLLKLQPISSSSHDILHARFCLPKCPKSWRNLRHKYAELAPFSLQHIGRNIEIQYSAVISRFSGCPKCCRLCKLPSNGRSSHELLLRETVVGACTVFFLACKVRKGRRVPPVIAAHLVMNSLSTSVSLF